MISEIKRKSLPAIARAVGLENSQPLQHFLANSPWNVQAVRDMRIQLLKLALKEREFIVCIDETEDKKKGKGTDILHQACASKGVDKRYALPTHHVRHPVSSPSPSCRTTDPDAQYLSARQSASTAGVVLGMVLRIPLPEHCETKSASALSRFLNQYKWPTRQVIRAVREAVLQQILSQPLSRAQADTTGDTRPDNFRKNWQVQGV